MKRIVKEKWKVFGEYGGSFSNLDDAKRCAREASKTPEYDYEASVYNEEQGAYYIDYQKGRCVRDGWSNPMKRAGKGKFNLDGKLVEKQMYTRPDGSVIIKHNGKIYVVNE